MTEILDQPGHGRRTTAAIMRNLVDGASMTEVYGQLYDRARPLNDCVDPTASDEDLRSQFRVADMARRRAGSYVAAVMGYYAVASLPGFAAVVPPTSHYRERIATGDLKFPGIPDPSRNPTEVIDFIKAFGIANVVAMDPVVVSLEVKDPLAFQAFSDAYFKGIACHALMLDVLDEVKDRGHQRPENPFSLNVPARVLSWDPRIKELPDKPQADASIDSHREILLQTGCANGEAFFITVGAAVMAAENQFPDIAPKELVGLLFRNLPMLSSFTKRSSPNIVSRYTDPKHGDRSEDFLLFMELALGEQTRMRFDDDRVLHMPGKSHPGGECPMQHNLKVSAEDSSPAARAVVKSARAFEERMTETYGVRPEIVQAGGTAVSLSAYYIAAAIEFAAQDDMFMGQGLTRIAERYAHEREQLALKRQKYALIS